MSRPIRVFVLAFLVVLTFYFFLPRLQGSRSTLRQSPNEYPTMIREDAIQCTSGSDCASSATPVPNVASKEAPSTLEYPAGFEHFDTSDPANPYHAGTYDLSESSEGALASSIKADEGKSYLTRLEAWVPYNERYNTGNQNPVILQMYRDEPGSNSVPYQSWIDKNSPRWTRTFMNDESLVKFVDGVTRDLRFLNETYHALPAKILKLDFLRYVGLYKDGGVYADVDTSCHKPIEAWYDACYAPNRGLDGRPSRAKQPGLIVGVDMDLLDDPRFDVMDDRRLSLANHVFAANRGHPALAHVIANIVNTTLSSHNNDRSFNVSRYSDVYTWTGRRMWTDSILAYIADTVQGFSESDLLGLKYPKVIGDICILPIAAFGSGQLKYKNSPESDVDGVLVKHFRMHSWEF